MSTTTVPSTGAGITNAGITVQGVLSVANDSVLMPTLNTGVVGFQLTGTWTGTATFEASLDGTNWVACNSASIPNGTQSQTATSNGIYIVPCSGFAQVRVRFSTATSGTITATGCTCLAEQITLSVTGNLGATVAQGIAAAAAGSWPVEVTDGTNILLTAAHPGVVSTGGTSTASVASGAVNTVVKGSAGRLCRVLVTTAGTGTGNVLIYDNATTNSGTVIGIIPATVVIGTYYTFDLPASAGITVANVASGPVLTVSYN